MAVIMKGIPKTINGDNVIAFTDAKTFKANFGTLDKSTLYGWYEDNPDANHLGMVQLSSYYSNYPLPMYLGMIERGAVIEVNGVDGRFTYDLPRYVEDKTMTVVDTSGMYVKPGIDETVFDLVLSDPYTAGDVLTYDIDRGAQCRVSDRFPVLAEGNAWRHKVQLVANGRTQYFPADKLRAGICYWKIDHAMGEFSTQFSHINAKSKGGTLTCEYILGSHRGVEAEVTMYAGMKDFSGATSDTQAFASTILSETEKMTQALGAAPAFAIIGQRTGNNSINMKTARVANAVQFLTMVEHRKLQNYGLMFQKGGIIRDGDSVIRMNEGLYHQLRRGFTITYTRPGGITRAHLMEASNYIFRGRYDIPIGQREMTFKAGAKAYDNVFNIFREEFYQQLEFLRPLMSSDSGIPNPISGGLDGLVLKEVKIRGVVIPSIGLVRLEHDPSLDYVEMTDRSSLVNGKTARTSYSLIMEDITSTAYSNAFSYPSQPGVNMKIMGNQPSNVYYVKPKGVNLWWGTKTGRWSNGGAATNIQSAYDYMAEQYWIHSVEACWVRDHSRFVLIELDPRSF